MIERYSRAGMAKIWEPQNRFDKWLQIEILVCEAMAKQEMIPQEAVETIKQKASFSVDRIQAIEETVKHDVNDRSIPWNPCRTHNLWPQAGCLV